MSFNKNKNKIVGARIQTRDQAPLFTTVGSSNSIKKWLKKIVGARIQTHHQAPLFTTVGTYDHCEMSFSKYKKKAPKKSLPRLTGRSL